MGCLIADVVEGEFGEEAELAGVDAEDGFAEVPEPAGLREQGAVAAEDGDEIGFGRFGGWCLVIAVGVDGGDERAVLGDEGFERGDVSGRRGLCGVDNEQDASAVCDRAAPRVSPAAYVGSQRLAGSRVSGLASAVDTVVALSAAARMARVRPAASRPTSASWLDRLSW